MNPNLMHQMAQARQADLLREAEEYRRAGLTARPTVLSRITARIPRLPTASRWRRPRVVVPSTLGRMPLLQINQGVTGGMADSQCHADSQAGGADADEIYDDERRAPDRHAVQGPGHVTREVLSEEAHAHRLRAAGPSQLPRLQQ